MERLRQPVATGRNGFGLFSPRLRLSRFAVDCHRLQPRGSIKAPSIVVCSGHKKRPRCRGSARRRRRPRRGRLRSGSRSQRTCPGVAPGPRSSPAPAQVGALVVAARCSARPKCDQAPSLRHRRRIRRRSTPTGGSARQATIWPRHPYYASTARSVPSAACERRSGCEQVRPPPQAASASAACVEAVAQEASSPLRDQAELHPGSADARGDPHASTGVWHSR
jgi:hypothetical protein